ncbi:Calvin cycle protein CP12 [Umezakia ovalisporum]|uniref:Calvin cycle protein CP12 n=1 Tax=Umezakia ovalisporum FSS-43 TaxID=2740520 RepID=A0ABT6K8M5_9CYAN|nr:Calvin cycle protein CP12 [Umezakia ovalisporum]MDH6058420.1 Calvin cycle protein CP12 [Umezakia ovalisporum FSS-43]MDH6066371.1 Calvin cycle protein CP12 [Umezakia ovalisporum APH033B]MDH6070526.1 Calvin cycle protein CP12 [Umezakia ovalisporum CobakiLakeA]MDH6074320.1 Calvin cycle protein CP12 [Umezakia ovalisporum CS-1034]MDH6079430.1 Calvin cycle protein CP12 [Umezakia ovalisporum FSS-45]
MTKTLEALQSAVNSGTKTLDEAILESIEEARETCKVEGKNSHGCAVAWDIVEELQAEKAHQHQAKQRKTALESYCEAHPDSIECLIYDV